ncbi:hypothetical protein ACP70R_045413 [Stipagrostis hirtigluma subsp. patula]
MTSCLLHFKDLVASLNTEAEASDKDAPLPVTCLVVDSTMTFALRAVQYLGLRCATLWSANAWGFIAYYHYRHLVERGRSRASRRQDRATTKHGLGGSTTYDGSTYTLSMKSGGWKRGRRRGTGGTPQVFAELPPALATVFLELGAAIDEGDSMVSTRTRGEAC